MKKSVRIISIMSICLVVLLLTACNKKERNIEGTLDEIMINLYENIPADKLPMSLENIEVDKNNIKNYIGTDDIEYESVVAREPMISSIAHSVVLIRTKDNADIEAIKTKIKDNVDPRKWICVWVEDEDVIIKNKGNLIVVIIVEDEEIRNTISNNFDNL